MLSGLHIYIRPVLWLFKPEIPARLVWWIES